MFLFLMEEIAMSSTAAVQAKWGLNSARNQWLVLQSAFTISYFHQQYVWIPVVPYLASTHVISIFTFRSSSECTVPSHSILPYYMVTCDAEHFLLISFVYILLKKLVFWLQKFFTQIREAGKLEKALPEMRSDGERAAFKMLSGKQEPCLQFWTSSVWRNKKDVGWDAGRKPAVISGAHESTAHE